MLRKPVHAIHSTNAAPNGGIVYFTGEHENVRWAVSVSAAGGMAKPVYRLRRMDRRVPSGRDLQDYPHAIERKAPDGKGERK